MIPVDTRSAIVHKLWRYVTITLKTFVFLSGILFSYYLVYKGFL
jgi:hypothetical protein